MNHLELYVSRDQLAFSEAKYVFGSMLEEDFIHFIKVRQQDGIVMFLDENDKCVFSIRTETYHAMVNFVRAQEEVKEKVQTIVDEMTRLQGMVQEVLNKNGVKP